MAEAPAVQAPPAVAPKPKKKRERKVGINGIAHVQSTFNNTIVTITDMDGHTVAWASAGKVGFKGSRKSTPCAAQISAESAAKEAISLGLKKVEVWVKGPGSGREAVAPRDVDDRRRGLGGGQAAGWGRGEQGADLDQDRRRGPQDSVPAAARGFDSDAHVTSDSSASGSARSPASSARLLVGRSVIDLA